MAVHSVVNLSALYGAFRLDAECYTPRMLRDYRTLASVQSVKLGTVALVTDGQHGYHEVDDSSPIRHLTAKCVGPGVVIDKGADRLALSTHEANPGSILAPDDILLSTAGTIGEAGIVTDGLLPANIDQDVARITLAPNGPVHPYFVCAFLRSEYGQFQCERGTTGQIQGHINLTALRDFDIPLLEQQDRVVAIMRSGLAAYFAADKAIAAAEEELTEALGLNHLDLMPQKSYSRPFRDLQTGHRFGAEYYMPCKQRALDALRKMPHHAIAYHAPSARDMWDPSRASPDMRVRNFDITDALEPFLDDSVAPQEAGGIGSTKKRFISGDVVISRLRSYLKEIAVVKTSEILPAVGSSEFIVLRPNPKGLSAETLMVFLRCSLVQVILRWSQDGSNHPRFAEEDLLEIPVPDAVLRAQKRIDSLVRESMEARREATGLFDSAKQTVEDMVAGKTAGSRT